MIDLASAFHRFYNTCRIQGAEPAVQQARLALCVAVRNVIHGRPVKNTDALANPQALELYRDLAELRD